MSESPNTPRLRVPAEERRTLILEAAREVFGRTGYHGTTTDQIAAAAGISQPYVVRMFGSKEALFLEVIDGAVNALLQAWRTALDESSPDADPVAVIGERFVDLAATSGLHTVLMQAFVSGAEPAIGAKAREGFLRIYRFLRDEAGVSDARVQAFLGSGMIFSVLLSVQMPALYRSDSDAAALLTATFGKKTDQVVEWTQPLRAE